MQPGYSVIVDYVRTPFAKASAAKRNGEIVPGHFADIDPVSMMVPLINALLERTGLDPKHVSNVLTGAVNQEYTHGLNIARHVSINYPDCKLGVETGGTTLDRFCASSMQALKFAAGSIALDPNEVLICTGVQNMSQVPMGGFNPYMNPAVQDRNVTAFMNMGITAERVAEMYGITRAEQDEFAFHSHRKAAAAQDNGFFTNEIVPLAGLARDNCVRADTTIAALAVLNTAFLTEKEGGTVTAGSSSPFTDGATAALVTSETFAVEHGLPIKARIVAFGECGLEPGIMGMGPVEASIRALKKSGLDISQIDAFEINEAFSVVPIAVMKELDKRGYHIDSEKLNLDGGAIAQGHPLGASGLRLPGHLSEIMNRNNLHYGLAAMCVGGGQGMAVVLENANFKPSPIQP